MVASDGVRAMMESALTARDRVGVQDFVLLENYTSEAAFIENLRKRFKENLIYVSGCSEEGLTIEWHIFILYKRTHKLNIFTKESFKFGYQRFMTKICIEI